MFILKKGHQPGVYVPLRALFLVIICVRPGWKLGRQTFSRRGSFVIHCLDSVIPCHHFQEREYYGSNKG